MGDLQPQQQPHLTPVSVMQIKLTSLPKLPGTHPAPPSPLFVDAYFSLTNIQS